MMSTDVERLIQLVDSDERIAWLQTNYASVDKALVATLRTTAQLAEQQDPNKTLKIGEILSEVAQFWGDDGTLAEAYLIQANARQLMGEFKHALQLYKDAGSLYQALQLPDEVANAAIGEILVHLALGDLSTALVLADTTIAHFQKNSDELRLARSLMNRGNIYARKGDFELALVDYEQAKGYFVDLEQSHYLGMIEANQGHACDELNRFRKAELHFSASKSYFDKSEMFHASAQVQHNLAYFAFSKGEYIEALHLFANARESFVQGQHTIDIAYVDLYRSEVYLALNLWEKAIEDAASASEYFRAAQIPWEEARAYLNEAVGLAHSGKSELSQTKFETARTLFANLEIPVWIALVDFYEGSILLQNGQYPTAKTLCERANGIFSNAGMINLTAQCQLNLGTIALAEDDVAVAEAYFAQSLSTLGDAKLPYILYQYHYGMAQVHEKSGEIELAQQAYLDAFANIEQIERTIGAEDYKISFRKDKQQIYDSHILFCLQQGGAEQHILAFSTLERAKARMLLSALERGLENQVEFPADSELTQKIHDLQQELALHYNRLFVPLDEDNRGETVSSLVQLVSERERELNRLIEQAQELYLPPDANQLDAQTATVSPLDVQQILPSGTTFLEYFVTEYSTTVFIINDCGFQTVTLTVERSLLLDHLHEVQAQMGRFRHGQPFVSQHSDILLQSIQETLQQLYFVLVEPVLAHIDADSELPDALLIVPHGILHFVPFHALYDGEKYLIQSFDISYAPSAAILCHLMKNTRSVPSSGPVVIGLSDSSIPQAEVEANRIATLMPDSKLYKGKNATSETLLDLKDQVPFLHLASHAFFRADNPKYSAIKLEDRWLTLRDLESLQLRADLVTLSACETGISQVHAGDELTGFYGMFFRNAAHALVLSLWRVDDMTTTELMTCFYTELSQGASCQKALRTAQNKVLSDYKHPYHWAGFILTGSPTFRLF